MRAKLQVRSVTDRNHSPSEPEKKTAEEVEFFAVTEKPFDTEGFSEDNQFAKWTPQADLKITINNPALFGAHVVGEKYYVDFTKAD